MPAQIRNTTMLIRSESASLQQLSVNIHKQAELLLNHHKFWSVCICRHYWSVLYINYSLSNHHNMLEFIKAWCPVEWGRRCDLQDP